MLIFIKKLEYCFRNKISFFILFALPGLHTVHGNHVQIQRLDDYLRLCQCWLKLFGGSGLPTLLGPLLPIPVWLWAPNLLLRNHWSCGCHGTPLIRLWLLLLITKNINNNHSISPYHNTPEISWNQCSKWRGRGTHRALTYLILDLAYPYLLINGSSLPLLS